MTMLQLPPGYVELLRKFQEHLRLHGVQGWIVGGYLRDMLLGRPSSDLDIALDGDATALARTFADATGGAWVPLDDERGVARIVWPVAVQTAGRPRTLDVVRLRAPSLEEDLQARDFTINALALPLEAVGGFTPDAIIDPLGGARDLAAGLLRATGPAALADDSLRMLRAIRIAAQLHLRLAPELEATLRAEHGQITRVAGERVRDELLKLLALPDAGLWVDYLDEVRLLTTIVPELEPARVCTQPSGHYFLVLDHLLESVVAADWLLGELARSAGSSETSVPATHEPAAPSLPLALAAIPELTARLPHAEQILARMNEPIDGVPRFALFKLAVLLHDVAKPQTKALKPDGEISFYDHQIRGAEVAYTIGRRLRLSRAACEYIRLVIREHMRPGQLSSLGDGLTSRAVYRFFRDTGAAGPDVLLHSLCDHLGMQGPLTRPAGWDWHIDWTARMLDAFYDESETVRPVPLLSGDDLMRELDLRPGPEIGRLLEAVREAQATGDVRTREDALRWARDALLVARQGLLVRHQEDE